MCIILNNVITVFFLNNIILSIDCLNQRSIIINKLLLHFKNIYLYEDDHTQYELHDRNTKVPYFLTNKIHIRYIFNGLQFCTNSCIGVDFSRSTKVTFLRCTMNILRTNTQSF